LPAQKDKAHGSCAQLNGCWQGSSTSHPAVCRCRSSHRPAELTTEHKQKWAESKERELVSCHTVSSKSAWEATAWFDFCSANSLAEKYFSAFFLL